MNTQHQQKRKIRQSCRRNAVPNRFSSRFSTSRTNAPRSLSQAKAGTHSPFREKSHTRAHTPKQGAFRMGVVSLPSERSTRFGNPAWPGGRTANFAAFGAWSGAPKERREPSGQRCAYARRCSEASRPRWAALLCLQFGDVAVFSLCVQYFLNVQGGRALSLPAACSACC